MKPLKLITTDHRPAVYKYGRLSNVIRILDFNRAQWIARNDNTTYVLQNQHPLVQLLSLMNIQPEWDPTYLKAMIEMQVDSWASTIGITSIYNKGVVKQNVMYANGLTEMLVSYPAKDNLDDYFDLDERDICSIIPLISTETDIRYTNTTSLKNDPMNYGGFAVIGVDITALGIGYWRYLNERLAEGSETGLGHHRYLAGTPLINARCLQHQLSVFNSLYNVVVNGENIDDQLTVVKGEFNINPVGELLKGFLTFLVETLTLTPSYSPEHVIQRIGDFMTMDVNPLIVDAKRYNRYSQTNAIWQFPIMKLLTLSLALNNKSFNAMGTVNGHIDVWSKQDIKGMIKHFIPGPLQVQYLEQVTAMLKQNKLSR